jgi:hypothetical protein
MPIKQIQAKARMPEALQYNAWAPIRLSTVVVPASAQTSTAIQAIIPLGLNYKITHISYVMSNFYTIPPAAPTGSHFVAGKMALNIVNGIGAYEGAGGSSSYGYLGLTGNFAINDKITVTIAGVPYSYTVSGRSVVNTFTVAASMAESLNRNTAFNTLYRANSLGLEIVVQTLAYSTATPTFTASVVTSNSGAISSTSGATMIAGVAGTLPGVPVSDTTSIGIVPSQTAAVGTALFPVDIILPLFSVSGQTGADVGGTLYALENFDVNWPTAAEMTLRITADGTVAGGLNVILWGVPNDIHPMMPEEASTAFHLSPLIL